jgi:hypothetical protein
LAERVTLALTISPGNPIPSAQVIPATMLSKVRSSKRSGECQLGGSLFLTPKSGRRTTRSDPGA